jgi:hypothetical protein
MVLLVRALRLARMEEAWEQTLIINEFPYPLESLPESY